MSDTFVNVKNYFLQMVPSLDEAALKDLEKCLVIRTYKKGTIICEAGKPNNIVSYIEKGAVIVYNNVDGKKCICNFFFEHEFTGDYESFLTRMPALYGFEAAEDTIVFDLHYDALQSLYSAHAGFERAGRLVAEAQFLRLVQRNSSLLLEKPEERYLNLIKEKPYITQRIPQYYVASFLGVTPEALSRIRKRIRVSG